MNKLDTLGKLLSKKAEVNNIIDLNAYESGMSDMYDYIMTELSERADTQETSDKHETEQLNILGVVRSLSEIEEKIVELRKERDKWIDRQRKYIFTKEEKLNGSTVFGNFQENEVKCTKQIQTLNWILGKC